MHTTAADLRALLAAVVADPADVAVRLVLADALEEAGEGERAAFIRRHIAACRRHGDRAFITGRTQYVNPECRDEFHREMIALTAWSSDSGNYPDPFLLRLANTNCLEWRRGFVERVTCTTAEWCGGPCPRCCGGMRGYGPTEGPFGCVDCNYTGRTPGHGPRLVRSAPVMEVRLSDREPHEVSGGRLCGWIACPREATQPWHVPLDLYGHLPEPSAGTFIGAPGLSPTAAAAHAALSAAALAWAKARPA